MPSLNSKIIRIALALLIVTSLAAFIQPRILQAQSDQVIVVKLYSGDKIVATWENARGGRMDGQTFVFTSGIQGRQVRVCGTFSVEEVR